MTGYVMYFNKRYDRVGPLFQGRYKARCIKDDPDLLNVLRYIHLNPVDLPNTDRMVYGPSSAKDYVSTTNNKWLNTKSMLSMFRDRQSLVKFTNDYIERRKEIAEIYKI